MTLTKKAFRVSLILEAKFGDNPSKMKVFFEIIESHKTNFELKLCGQGLF